MIYESQSGNIRMVLAGEVMPSRHLTPFIEPDYLAAIELIRAGDVAFTNLETVVRLRDEGTPAFTRGTPMTTAPVLLDDLKWMGFNLMSTANNHMARDLPTLNINQMGEYDAATRHLHNLFLSQDEPFWDEVLIEH